MNNDNVLTPLNEAALIFYRAYTKQNGFDLTDEEIHSLNYFELLSDSMAPHNPKGTIYMSVRRDRETLPRLGGVVVIMLQDKPDRVCAGRLKKATEHTITLSFDNPAYQDWEFAWANVGAIYEVLWYAYKLP